MDPGKGARLRSWRKTSQFYRASSISRFPWNFQLSGLSTKASRDSSIPLLCFFLQHWFCRQFSLWVSFFVYHDSLRLPGCLSNLGSRGLPYIHPSLTDPRKVLVFKSIWYFFFLVVRMTWRLPSSLHAELKMKVP